MDSTNPLPVIVVFCAGLAYSSRKKKKNLHIVNTLKVIYPTPSKILLKVEREPIAQILYHPPSSQIQTTVQAVVIFSCCTNLWRAN